MEPTEIFCTTEHSDQQNSRPTHHSAKKHKYTPINFFTIFSTNIVQILVSKSNLVYAIFTSIATQ